MKTAAFVLWIMVVSMSNVFGMPPPAVIDMSKHRSEEQLILKVGSITTRHLRDDTVYVRIRAKVESVLSSKHRIRPGRWITIRYRYRQPKPYTLGGTGGMLRLKKGQYYRAYLNRSPRRWFYEPVAGSHSFVPLTSREKPHAIPYL